MLETSIAIVLVVGIVEAFKRAFKMPSRYAALVSLIVGIGYAILFRGDIDLIQSIYLGIVIGLSSAGLYSGAKKTITG